MTNIELIKLIIRDTKIIKELLPSTLGFKKFNIDLSYKLNIKHIFWA